MSRPFVGILLDTNAFLEIVSSEHKPFGKNAQRVVDSSDVVYISAVSLFEIQVKRMLGKLKVKSDLADVIQKTNLIELPVTNAHALGVDRFPSLREHDPFDRILLSQVACEGLTLLTSDQTLVQLNLTYVLDSQL
jgi:PIN domain nuclease of toxin-antitoxin system